MYSKDYYESADYDPRIIGIEIFQKISQHMPYMVFITRAPDFQLLYANRKVSEFLGFNLDDLREMEGRIWDMMDAEDIALLLDTAQKTQHIRDDQALKILVKVKSKKGDVVHLETSISIFKRDPAGEPLEYICISEDVTEKVLLEMQARNYGENLNKYEATLQQAEKHLNLGTWEWDISQNKVKWSEGFWDLLEYPPGERLYDWMPLERYFQHVQLSENGGDPKERALAIANTDGAAALDPSEANLLTYTGKSIYVATHTQILEWKEGKPSLAVGSTVDLSKMKNIQKNLEAKVAELAKAYDEVEQFSYVASHDLQEPLRKIIAFGERLKEKCSTGLSPDCALYLDRIMDATNRMRILIENLLTLSRTKRNADYFKPTDLNEIFKDVASDLDNKISDLTAQINHAQLPVIEAIPTQMHQLFLNLLTNSLKFKKEDTRPIIAVDYTYLTTQQKNEYNLDIQQDYLHLEVKDNGIGFDSTYAETIFSPFKRLHGRSEYEGTGIGLAICKKVVQNHQGIIWADSNPGEGATFHVVLAVQQPTDV